MSKVTQDDYQLDAHPRRCFMCGVKIFNCNGFVLARDLMPIIQALLEKRPSPLVKVRELCGQCIFVWDSFAEKEYGY